MEGQREERREEKREGKKKRSLLDALSEPTGGYISSDRRNILSITQSPSNRTAFQSPPACSIQKNCNHDHSRVYTHRAHSLGESEHSLGDVWCVFRTVPALSLTPSSLPPGTPV